MGGQGCRHGCGGGCWWPIEALQRVRDGSIANVSGERGRSEYALKRAQNDAGPDNACADHGRSWSSAQTGIGPRQPGVVDLLRMPFREPDDAETVSSRRQG